MCHRAVLIYQQGVLECISIQTLSTRDSIQACRLRPQSFKLNSHPQTPQIPVKSPGCHLYFWPTGYKSEVPATPSLCLINLLEWFIELRKIFYILEFWFIIKGSNSGIARWKRHTEPGMGKGAGLPYPLSVPVSPNLHVFANPEALWSLVLLDFY